MRVFYWFFLQVLFVGHLLAALAGIAWGVSKLMLWMLT